MPSVPGATEKQAAPLPNEAGELCWRYQRSGFCDVEKPAGGTDKAERRQELGAAVQAQPLPWTAGLRNGERDMSLSSDLSYRLLAKVNAHAYSRTPETNGR